MNAVEFNTKEFRYKKEYGIAGGPTISIVSYFNGNLGTYTVETAPKELKVYIVTTLFNLKTESVIGIPKLVLDEIIYGLCKINDKPGVDWPQMHNVLTISRVYPDSDLATKLMNKTAAAFNDAKSAAEYLKQCCDGNYYADQLLRRLDKISRQLEQLLVQSTRQVKPR